MGLIRVRQPWTQQPQVAVGIDWGNPLTNGLVESILPAQRRSSVRGIIPTSSGTMTVSPGLKGIGLKTSANDGSKDAYAGAWSQLLEMTMLALFRLDGKDSVGRICGTYVGGTSGYALSTNATNSRCFYYGSVPISLSGAALTTGEKCWLMRCDGSTVDLFEQGVKTASASGTLIVGTGDFCIGADNSSNSCARANRYLSAVWNRALYDHEIASISANPWQLFAP